MWQGGHNGYARLGVQHVRSVLSLDGDRWLVGDHLFARRLIVIPFIGWSMIFPIR